MRGVVRAGVDAAWFFQVRAEVAGSCFLLDGGFLAAGAFGIIHHHFERVQINIAVRTILRAEAATDAPILDDDFERISPSNRTDGAADHAKRVAALAATRGDEILVESQAIADEAGDPRVRAGAGIDTNGPARSNFANQKYKGFPLPPYLREEIVHPDDL